MVQRVRLTFLDRLIKEPVVYQLGKKFDIVTNIRRADIQEGIGWVILELEGDDAEIDRGLEWARTVGVRVDPALGDLVEP
ncbi:MAG: NIL domain-containing protein [Chloroflexi bacterium]|nr:NIL domain-containing protein [Chloroflexota bacterium]MCI0888764.1 NIL domain-containing protein [Chloroflexota bacterium]